MTQSIAEHIATLTDYPEVHDINALIEGLAEQQIAAHGIRTSEKVGAIALEGILPNCPDVSPRASFWTSGRRTFFSDESLADGSTFDTSFFHYAHSKTVDPNVRVMSLALTTNVALTEVDDSLTKDAFKNGYFSIENVVPASHLHLISVSETLNPQLDAYQQRMSIERKMLSSLFVIAQKGIRLGHQDIR